MTASVKGRKADVDTTKLLLAVGTIPAVSTIDTLGFAREQVTTQHTGSTANTQQSQHAQNNGSDSYNVRHGGQTRPTMPGRPRSTRPTVSTLTTPERVTKPRTATNTERVSNQEP